MAGQHSCASGLLIRVLGHHSSKWALQVAPPYDAYKFIYVLARVEEGCFVESHRIHLFFPPLTTTAEHITHTAITRSSQVTTKDNSQQGLDPGNQLWGGRGSASSAALIRRSQIKIFADYSHLKMQRDVCRWVFPLSPSFRQEQATTTYQVSTAKWSCGLTWFVPASCSSLP